MATGGDNDDLGPRPSRLGREARIVCSSRPAVERSAPPRRRDAGDPALLEHVDQVGDHRAKALRNGPGRGGRDERRLGHCRGWGRWARRGGRGDHLDQRCGARCRVPISAVAHDEFAVVGVVGACTVTTKPSPPSSAMDGPIGAPSIVNCIDPERSTSAAGSTSTYARNSMLPPAWTGFGRLRSVVVVVALRTACVTGDVVALYLASPL